MSFRAIFLNFIFLFTSCAVSLSLAPHISLGQNIEGRWLATLETQKGDLPFELVIQKTDDKLSAAIVNGPETIPVILKSEGEHLTLDFPVYDSRIEFKPGENEQLTGVWKKRRGNDHFTEVSFRAIPLVEPDDLDDPKPFLGRWEVVFEGDEDPAVADFGLLNKSSQLVTGTFLTTTGDYRYLAGSVRRNQLTLSCFDGAHAFLFHASLDGTDELKGDFCSGNWHVQNWSAKRNENAELPDATKLTQPVDGVELNELEFASVDGELNSIGEFVQGKPAIIEIFGTWCPNCHDAAKYLTELHSKYHEQGLEVLGLAFEVTDDPERNARQVNRYAEQFQVNYPILIAGPADKTKATETFQFLDRIRSYPTFIFVDAEGKVVQIYQGFSGPATGQAFDNLRKSFEVAIETIMR